MSSRWTPDAIRNARLAARMHQSDLAAALGGGRRAVTNWETGAGTPSDRFLARLDDVLGPYRPATRPDGVLLEDATVEQLLARLAVLYAARPSGA